MQNNNCSRIYPKYIRNVWDGCTLNYTQKACIIHSIFKLIFLKTKQRKQTISFLNFHYLRLKIENHYLYIIYINLYILLKYNVNNDISKQRWQWFNSIIWFFPLPCSSLSQVRQIWLCLAWVASPCCAVLLSVGLASWAVMPHASQRRHHIIGGCRLVQGGINWETTASLLIILDFGVLVLLSKF